MMRKQIYLSGSSIIEVLIALAIISLCAAIVSVIYLNLQKSCQPFMRMDALLIAETYIKKYSAEPGTVQQVHTSDEFLIKIKKQRAGNYNDCYVVEVAVYNKTKMLIYRLEQTVYDN